MQQQPPLTLTLLKAAVIIVWLPGCISQNEYLCPINAVGQYEGCPTNATFGYCAFRHDSKTGDNEYSCGDFQTCSSLPANRVALVIADNKNWTTHCCYADAHAVAAKDKPTPCKGEEMAVKVLGQDDFERLFKKTTTTTGERQQQQQTTTTAKSGGGVNWLFWGPMMAWLTLLALVFFFSLFKLISLTPAKTETVTVVVDG